MIRKFYVYRHFEKDSNVVFYVGKGTGNRAYDLRCRSDRHKNIVSKYGCRVELIFENLTDEEACAAECLQISYYRSFGQCRANVLPGGQSNAGQNNPMYGRGCLLTGNKNGMFQKIGKMKGKFGKEHPRFGKIESSETRALKKVMHLGVKHPKHKWTYVTPAGIFTSPTLAANANSVGIPMLKGRAKSKNYPEWTRYVSR